MNPKPSNYDLTGINHKYFWSRIDPPNERGCHEWNGRRTNGYGALKLHGRHLYAHRVAWTLMNGPLSELQVICHSCDNPACCNVHHMVAGSYSDNNHDARTKGRHRVTRGASRPNSLLSDALVLAIRRSNANGATMKELSTQYGVSMGAIQCVVQGRTWTHLPTFEGRRTKYKLTTQQLKTVLRLLASGKLLHREIAARFGVSRSWITMIAGAKRGLYRITMPRLGSGTQERPSRTKRSPLKQSGR